MSNNALGAQGLKLAFGDTGSPNNFSDIPELFSIGGPDGQSSWIDTTDLDSTAKEGRPGLQDNGQVRLGINYLPDNAVHAAMRTAWANRTLKRARLTFTDSTSSKWEFDVYVIGFSVRGQVDDKVQADVTLRITGDIDEVG